MIVKLIFGLMFCGAPGVAMFMTLSSLMSRSTSFSHFMRLLGDSWVDIVIYLPFIAVGLPFLISSLKQIFANLGTKVSGKVTFGYVFDFESAHYIVNGREMFNAKIVILDENGKPKIFSEEIGSWSKCKEYDRRYVKVQYGKKDLNIIEIIDSNSVYSALKHYVDTNYPEIPEYTENKIDASEDVVVINGVRYIKKSSIKKRGENLDA